MTQQVFSNRRRQFLTIAAASGAIPHFHEAWGQSFPSRSIKLIVGYAPGGAADTLGRLIVAKAQERFGQTILVDNRPGAGGLVAAEATAKSLPDGYTLFLSDDAQLAIAPAIGEPRAAWLDGLLTPVVGLTALPMVLVINNNLPVTSLKELIEFAKKKPGSLNCASAGNGNISHVSAELFKNLSRTFVTHISYPGGTPGLASVLAGDTQMMFVSIPTAIPHIKAGKVRALAVANLRRSSALPDVPTAFEAGLAGMVAVSWHGVVTPKGTPASVMQKIYAGFSEIVQLPEISERLRSMGFETTPRNSTEFANWIGAETEKWKRLAKVARIGPGT